MSAGPLRQRGFGLLETALIVLLVGAIVAASFIVLQSSPPVRAVEDQERALQWADQALVAYAAKYAQLPCPVSTPNGTSCVGPAQKGWLPVKALAAVHPEGTGPGRPLRYIVYRGAGTGSDLAVAGNEFNPHKWDGTLHSFDAVNGTDLCAKLANAARESAAAARGDRARTTDIDAHLLNVAYGLSAAGDAPGDTGRFDGLNQQSAAQMESPARTASASYDDRVRVRDFNSLAQTLGCAYADATNPDGVVLASLDTLALSVDVDDEVSEQREGNVEDTELAVSMASVAVVFASLNVALAGANISNSASTLATASSQLASAIASCVVLVGCALIPPYTAAVVAGGIAVGLSATATALAAAALVPTSLALADTVVARDMAKAAANTAPPDFSHMADQACLASEGGMRSYDVDADGNIIPIDPPVQQDGLLQQKQKIEQDIADIKAEMVDIDRRLDAIDANTIPSNGNPLIWTDYAKPVRSDYKTDDDFNAALKKWEDGSSERLKQWRKQLADKLAAIRRAEDAHLLWDQAKARTKDASTDLANMQKSILDLSTSVAQCDATPPSTLDGKQACENNRQALHVALTCDTTQMSAQQQADRQCLTWKQEDYDAAVQAEADALSDYQTKAYQVSTRNDDPPINNYIEQGWWCGIFNVCNQLYVRFQDDDDDRETYGRTYYQKLHLAESLRLKEEELAEKQAAYDKAHAQCETLKKLAGQSASGVEIPVWAGADAVLQAANCKGTSGPVQPTDCGGH